MRSVAEAAWSLAQDRAPLGAEQGHEPLPGVCGSLGKFAKVPLHESESPWLTRWQLGWNRTAHVGTLAAESGSWGASLSLGFPGCRMGPCSSIPEPRSVSGAHAA